MSGKGFKWTRTKVYGGGLIALVFLGLIGMLSGEPGSVETGGATQGDGAIASAPTSPTPSPSPSAEKPDWMKGESLYDATTVEWRKASYETKLTTCGEFVARALLAEQLTPEIQASATTPDRVRVLAETLVTEIDKAVSPSPDGDQSPGVALNEVAVLAMIELGWISSGE